MYLDKEAYERAGLVGKPHGAKGNRGLRPRWSMSILPTTTTLTNINSCDL